MQRQRALADPALAGADGHEMTHPGEPIGYTGALLGNLLENSGPSVTDDVVVALHFLRVLRGLIAYTAAAAQEELAARLLRSASGAKAPGPQVAFEIRKRKELSHGDLDCHRARCCAVDRAVGSLLHLVHPSRESARTHLVHVVEAPGPLRHWPGRWRVPADPTRHGRCAGGSLLILGDRRGISAKTRRRSS